MPRYDWIDEFQRVWLPNLTDSALARLTELVLARSRFLIAGRFDAAVAQGCLATHAGWHHPQTTHMNAEAGIGWLTRVAGLNPATSRVVLAWDAEWPDNHLFREALTQELLAETVRRR